MATGITLANLKALGLAVKDGYLRFFISQQSPRTDNWWDLTTASWTAQAWRDLCSAEGWPHATLATCGADTIIRIEVFQGRRIAPAGVRELRRVVWTHDTGVIEAEACSRGVFLQVPTEGAEALAKVLLDLVREHLSENEERVPF